MASQPPPAPASNGVKRKYDEIMASLPEIMEKLNELTASQPEIMKKLNVVSFHIFFVGMGARAGTKALIWEG